jgi:putative ABC transport system permease protein
MIRLRRALQRVRAVLTVAAKRLVAQRGLALATLLGLVTVVALIMSIPLYAEGVYYRVLSEGLFSDTPRYRGQAVRPPVSLLFRYVGAFSGPLEWLDVAALDDYLTGPVYRDLRLPPSPDAAGARMFNTGLFGLYTPEDVDVVTETSPEYQVAFVTLGDLDRHVTLVEGDLPADTPIPEGVFEVLVSRFIADTMGIQVGETYVTYDRRAQNRFEDAPALFEVRIAGVWEPTDPHAAFWEYSQVPPDNALFVSRVTFANRISPVLEDEIYQALWYLPLDAEQIYVNDVAPLLRGIELLQRRVATLLPHTTLDVSPVEALERYEVAANVLTVQLFAFSVPILGLTIAFVALVVALSVERQRHQVAALRSRGATVPQVTGIATLESALLGALALMVALPVSLLIAYGIGQVRSFLDFSLATDIRVGLTWPTVRFGVLALVLTLMAQVVPTLGAARHTIVTYKRERARLLRPPWWQRLGLDVLLLIPAAYGAYLLRQQGLLQSAEAATANPFENPLLFLVPALSLFALTLVLLRLLPLVMRAFAWLGGQTRSVGFLMAARQLARSPGLYAAPLGLLVLTLSLSTYTASLAATLDTHLHDQQYYRVGADASLVDTGDPLDGGGSGPGEDVDGGLRIWRFLPVAAYRTLPGVRAATRVGQYPARVQTPEGFRPGEFIAVDRADFAQVAFWREDFSAQSLGALMNRLALTPDGVLLPRDFMVEQVLDVGDTVNVSVVAYERSTSLRLTIVGSFAYFPTWYPETGPLAVGNLDYFFQEAQAQLPYRVWMETAPDVDYGQLSEDAWDLSLGAEAMMAAPQRILEAQRDPARQGLLGLLSVGFGAAAVLTALGFILYALFSFRRRAVELGVLRASGLSLRHMATFVAWELAFLVVAGGAAGTGLGIWASHAFVPHLQIGAGAAAHVPPFDVTIAWPALLRLYALFALLFIAALAVLLRLLVRMKLFQAIKLGETL